MKRWLVALALAGSVLQQFPAAPARAQAACRFVLGFLALRDLLGPAVVGACLEDEHFDPASGNAEQWTTGGLLVWRKLDNWTAFTDGYRTWVNGPAGVQQRLNSERFSWENDPPAPPADAAPAPTPPPMTSTPEAQRAIDAALGDAAARLGVGRDQLRVAHVEYREWPDSSLGCPQPGAFYLQVITPGYLIVVAGAGKQLEYHTNTSGRAVFCRER